jgi:hypothetical protein
MKISAQVSLWMAVALAIFCLGYAFTAFSSIDSNTTDELRDATRGFGYFWLFLGGVATVIALISWLMAKGKLGGEG